MNVVKWLVLTTFVALVVAGAAVRERFVRFFFELEEPRPIAAFRIALAVLVVLHVHGLSPHFELLFGPTGMFTPTEARQNFASGGSHAPVSIRRILPCSRAGSVASTRMPARSSCGRRPCPPTPTPAQRRAGEWLPAGARDARLRTSKMIA